MGSISTFWFATIAIGSLAIAGSVYYVSYKIKKTSRAIFGTEDVMSGFKKLEEEYAKTPKSIAGVTKLFLPQILDDFPEFHYEEMRERAEHILVAYLLSIDELTPQLPSYVSSDLKHQLDLYIDMLKAKSHKEFFKSMKTHDCQLRNYTKEKGKCCITFQVAIQYYHYKKDNVGKIIDGKENILFQSRYNIDMIYIQDRDLVEGNLDGAIGLNCPNCGAPIKNLGQKYCEYCGSGIVEFNINSWIFNDVEEVK